MRASRNTCWRCTGGLQIRYPDAPTKSEVGAPTLRRGIIVRPEANMDSAAVQKIVKEIEGYTLRKESESVGLVTAVGDGVVAIDGLSKAVMSEVVLFEGGKGKHLSEAMSDSSDVVGLILNLEEDGVRAAILGETSRVAEGMTVKSTGRVLSVPASDEMLGRVVSPLAEPIDGKGPFKKTTMMPVERQAAGVIDRKAVSIALQTGTKAIDAMIPI